MSVPNKLAARIGVGSSARLFCRLFISPNPLGFARKMIGLGFLIAVTFGASTDLHGIDLNGDGMSDVWTQKYSVPSADAGIDYTGNGLTNLEKSLLGLDPRDPNARFHLELIFDRTNNELRLRIDTVYGKRYQSEISGDLATWAPIGVLVIGTGGQEDVVTTLSSVAAPAFFRCRLADDIDEDGDGLTAWEEREVGTSDSDADSDGDGMPDGWEFAHGLNPLTNDASEDPDGDGLTNLQEYQNGTDPFDYFNGQRPLLHIISGDAQFGAPSTQLPQPLVVEVRDQSGNVLANAPVDFALIEGQGQLSDVSLHTDASGLASISFMTSPEIGAASIITAVTGPLPNRISVNFHVGNMQPPHPPSDVVTVTNPDGSIDMKWSDNSDNEEDFAIQLRNADGEWEMIGSVPANRTSVHINPDRTIGP